MILEQIVADNRLELEYKKGITPLAELQSLILEQLRPIDLASVIYGDDVKLIAEIKRASPSKGIIRHDFDPVEIAMTFAVNGAAAISILTETKYFQGDLSYLKIIKDSLGNNRLPLLRKDFIFEPYQVYESRAYGADSLLLIVAILTPEILDELLNISHELGMNCLVEVHNETELEIALSGGSKIIGINNRSLSDFSIDLTVTERLMPLIPPDRIVVSESGIRDKNDILKMRQWGVNVFLIGEVIMSAPDIAVKMKELL